MNNSITHTVLIAEDDEMNREILAEMLSDYYVVITAKDGQEALDFINYLARSENLHLIISDYRMPKMSGIDLLEQAKNIVPHAKRILLTGCTDVSVMIEAVNRAHVYKYIEKPFDAEYLLSTIKDALDKYEEDIAVHNANHELSISNNLLTLEMYELEQAYQKVKTDLELEITERTKKEKEQEIIMGRLQDTSGNFKILKDVLQYARTLETSQMKKEFAAKAS